jgi:hypothetical protein
MTMGEHKYKFLPSADPATHLGFDDPTEAVNAAMAHLTRIQEEAPTGVTIAVSMRDADFGPDPDHMWTGLAILAHIGAKSVPQLEKDARANEGIAVGFIIGMDTLEFVKHSHRHPDAWSKGNGPFVPFERPTGRLH